MIYYINLIIALILGQTLYTVITVYPLQKDKQIRYRDALTAYVNAEFGGYVVVLVTMAVLLFVLSDFVDVTVDRKDLVEVKTLKEKLIFYFRTIMTCIGVFVQHLVFLLFKKGKKAIEKENQKIDLS